MCDEHILRAAVVRHLGEFLGAYAGAGWLPKHHLSLDLADALGRFGCLMSLLVHEMKFAGEESQAKIGRIRQKLRLFVGFSTFPTCFEESRSKSQETIRILKC